ncbi:hypothetical protein [Actinomadura sp. 6K520]|uniref:hypothetical protein n=1 Tax=Actinomadura sp. 6K520 TaxID=2530364 RepID=UPI001404D77D|nr:hypothetical protein [Actinomadura sp. 6K520]
MQDETADATIADLRASVTDMRSTARWITGAAAAVGAVVLAGGPLTVVDKLDDTGDVVAAISGLLLALAGVAWTVWRTSDVLTPRVTTIEDLGHRDLSGLRAMIDRYPAAFYGPFSPDPAELRRERVLRFLVKARIAKALARESDPKRRQILEQAAVTADANARLAQRTQERLLAWIHAWQVRQSLRRARRDTALASLVVLVGAALYLTAPLDKKDSPSMLRVCLVTPTSPGTATAGKDACAR